MRGGTIAALLVLLLAGALAGPRDAGAQRDSVTVTGPLVVVVSELVEASLSEPAACGPQAATARVRHTKGREVKLEVVMVSSRRAQMDVGEVPAGLLAPCSTSVDLWRSCCGSVTNFFAGVRSARGGEVERPPHRSPSLVHTGGSCLRGDPLAPGLPWA